MKFLAVRIKKALYSIYLRLFLNPKGMGFCGRNVVIDPSVLIIGRHNLYMHDNTNIYGNSTIMCTRAKFIMKKNAGASFGLTVVTGNHMAIVGRWSKGITDQDKDNHPKGKNYDRDIIVNEDVRMGTNVTLLAGANIGRGAFIGSGSVCRRDVPPYAVTMGNPAKVVGFIFTPDEIIEHEKVLYTLEERLPYEVLKKNYEKYFLENRAAIAEFKDLLITR